MDALIGKIEKAKPFFEKVSRNKYLKAIRDGFMSAMPVVLFSSIFMLLAYVPNIFGFYWPSDIEAMILKPYNYSMGLLAVLVAGTTAKNLCDSLNRDMPVNRQINNISTLMAGIVGFLVVGVDSIKGGFSSGYMGSKGLLTAFLVAFFVCNVYKFCVKRNITIHMPEEVPPNISQTFADVIPFGVSILLLALFDIAFRHFVGMCFAESVIEFFKPLFTAADGYLGLAIIYGAMSLFWFVGIQGPSIVEPAVSAIYYVNIANNLELFQAGKHAANILTPGCQQFVATLGGTGATLVVTLMFAFMAKSKELRAVGKASSIPVLFGVNEPILFGAPLILNPIFFIPFILTSTLNCFIAYLCTNLGIIGKSFAMLSWNMPSVFGAFLSTMDIKALILVVALIVLDGVIYYPFLKVQEKELLEVEEE